MIYKNNKSNFSLLIAFLLIFGLAGCGSTGDSSKPDESNEEARAKAEQDIIAAMAKIPKSSPLSKIELGMSDTRVRNVAGNPDDAESYQTGKAWIPFYFGSDVARSDWVYYGEGRVVFSISRYSGNLKVINVIYNPDLK